MAIVNYGKHTYGNIKIIGLNRTGIITVGNFCSIARGVRAFMFGDHKIENITTYPFGHARTGKLTPSLSPDFYMDDHDKNISIGSDVWIGFGAVIFRGVEVGDGAVIGAYSVITKDIPPFAVAVGHSRIIKKRFPDRDIKFLMNLKWWNFNDKLVSSIVPILMSNDMDALRSWHRKNRGRYENH